MRVDLIERRTISIEAEYKSRLAVEETVNLSAKIKGLRAKLLERITISLVAVLNLRTRLIGSPSTNLKPVE